MEPTQSPHADLEALDRFLGETDQPDPVGNPHWIAAREVLRAQIPAAEGWDVDGMLVRLQDAVHGNDVRVGAAVQEQATDRRPFAQQAIQKSIASAPRRDFSRSALPLWIKYSVGAIVSGFLIVMGWHVVQPTNIAPPIAYTTYTTRPGQRASLTLIDGSRVTLGPVTTLRVERTSAPGVVAVDVTGEAHFTVNHAATRPFVVTSHGVTTRVLGTDFLVRAYDASLVRVAVREGRVSVQSQSLTAANAAIVSRGQAVSVTPNTVPAITSIPDLATDFAWINGELVLHDVPLGDAFVRLSRWYGVEFRVSDPPLLNARVDAVFPSTFSRMEVNGLAKAIGAEIAYAPHVITFSTAR